MSTRRAIVVFWLAVAFARGLPPLVLQLAKKALDKLKKSGSLGR